MWNLESQENELLSLQSIYEEKEFIVDCMDPPSGRIVAEVRLTEDFYIKLAKGEKLSATDPINVDEGFPVAHLPPINIFFKFPETYPQETCPAFLLSCNWLTLEQLSALCKQLEALWEMNKDAILYTWIQFLQDEALDFLNINKFLDITDLLTFKIRDNFRNLSCNDSEDQNTVNGNSAESCKPMGQFSQVVPSVSGGDGEIDTRAFNELSDGKMLIQLLKDYNSCKLEDVFYKNYQECNVCLLTKQGSEFMIFKDCKHFFCRNCVKEYFESQIKDGNVNSLKCLQEECQTTSDGSTVKKLVSSELYGRYDRILLSTTLEGMSDIAYCPRRDCQCACIIDTCGRMGSCSACGFVFCPLCKMTYHGVAPCNFKIKTEQRKNVFDEYINGNAVVKEGIEKRYGKRVIQALIEDTLSESWKDSNSKSCPHCRASIEKTEGCNKMTCFRCGSFFCWLCMKMLASSNPYSHYSDRASKCYNLLFPEDYMLNNDFDVEPDLLDDFELV